MGVIIQEMVDPEFSGVVFTKNPLTGLDEIVVESVEGLGEALVQAGVTPDRWVYKWGEWIENTAPGDLRCPVIEDVIREADELEKLYKAPLDLEWSYDGERLYWLQLREITALESAKLYSNRIAREFLPGMIKPLVWSVNIPVVNSSWKRLFKEVIGSTADSIDINNLSKQFYYRAYFNMGVVGDVFEALGMPREALEILAGIESQGEDRPAFKPSSKTFVHLPRMLLTAFRKLFFSKPIEKFLRDYRTHYDRLNDVNLQTLDAITTLTHIDKLFELNKYGSYMVIVSQLLNSLYNMMLNRMLTSRDIETDGLARSAIQKRLREADPREMLQAMSASYNKLPDARRALIESQGVDSLAAELQGTRFLRIYKRFMELFGHLSDSGNDFSRPSWRETPELVFEMMKNTSSDKLEQTKKSEALEAFLEEKRFHKVIYEKAMRYKEYRELVNSLYTYGYSLFRKYFLHLASLLQRQAVIQDTDDIFYLKYGEIRALIGSRLSPEEAMTRVKLRRSEMEEFVDYILPEIIFGDAAPLNVDERMIGKELKGVATSGGSYTGPAKRIMGPSDFEKIEEGDVLVIPYSDISWTPLFTKARAVVSESGGLLSHCSIVAREYGIPAVVSVNAATSIDDGTTLAVDGNNGRVLVIEAET
jgi:pyruvate,water dikinase